MSTLADLNELDQLATDIHDWAKAKGWWDGGIENRSLGDQFANFHAEISEAWEEYRVHGVNPDRFIYYGPEGKPEGIAVELADEIIRILDTCKAYDIPIAEAILVKMKYNATRPHRHGGKLA